MVNERDLVSSGHWPLFPLFHSIHSINRIKYRFSLTHDNNKKTTVLFLFFQFQTMLVLELSVLMQSVHFNSLNSFRGLNYGKIPYYFFFFSILLYSFLSEEKNALYFTSIQTHRINIYNTNFS